MSILVAIYEILRVIVFCILQLYATGVFIISDDRTEKLTALSVMILILLYIGTL